MKHYIRKEIQDQNYLSHEDSIHTVNFFLVSVDFLEYQILYLFSANSITFVYCLRFFLFSIPKGFEKTNELLKMGVALSKIRLLNACLF